MEAGGLQSWRHSLQLHSHILPLFYEFGRDHFAFTLKYLASLCLHLHNDSDGKSLESLQA